MKFALILATLTLFGCSHGAADRIPTTPSTPAPLAGSLTFLWAMVVDETGVCIAGATLQVVRGQAVGQPITQATPCDAWAYDGGVMFRNLTPGVEMTLRASAPGYSAQEKTIIPSLGGQLATLFTPARIQ